MRNLDVVLKNRKINYYKLIEYGFSKKSEEYVYSTNICDNQFAVYICFSDSKKVSKVIDKLCDEEYVLVDVEETTGEFVGNVRKAYDEIISDVIEKCSDMNIFKFVQTKQVIEYVKEKYNTNMEFLWEDSPENAVMRNDKNQKWYGIIMTIKEDRLNIDSKKEIEVINVRYQKNLSDEVIDNNGIFPGFHMNKSSWITIKLDDTLNFDRICELIDNSYNIVDASKK